MFLARTACSSCWQRQVFKPNNVSRHPLLLHHAKPRQPGIRSFRSNTKQQNSMQTLPFEDYGGSGYVGPNKIIKALIFTGTFTLGSFMGATIMEYENTRNLMLERARQTKFAWLQRKSQIEENVMQRFKRETKGFWDKLTPGEKVFAPICALNLIVFGLWRVPRLRHTMLTYFSSNPASRVICWPMLLSTFSHYSAFHLFANMYVLHSFSNAAVMALGKEQFLAMYLSAGVVASLTSVLYKAMTAQVGMSIGASGAIMGVLAYVCSQYPDTQLSILFLPMVTFSAGAAIKVIMGIDLAGCILGWKFFDHAAHLGGAMFGLLWAYYGADMWQQRLPLLNLYHDLRKDK